MNIQKTGVGRLARQDFQLGLIAPEALDLLDALFDVLQDEEITSLPRESGRQAGCAGLPILPDRFDATGNQLDLQGVGLCIQPDKMCPAGNQALPDQLRIELPQQEGYPLFSKIESVVTRQQRCQRFRENQVVGAKDD